MTLEEMHHQIVDLEIRADNKVKEHKAAAKDAKAEMGDTSKLWPQGMPDCEKYKYEDNIKYHEDHAEKWDHVRRAAHVGKVSNAFRDDSDWLASHGSLYSAAVIGGRVSRVDEESLAEGLRRDPRLGDTGAGV